MIFSVAFISAQGAGRLIHGGVVNGKALSLPEPEFPAAAKAIGAGGAVNVEVVIDEEGNVESAEAVSGHPLLRSASENAARQAKFSPSKLEGHPAKVSGVIIYTVGEPIGDDEAIAVGEIEHIGISASLRLMERVNTDPKLSSVTEIFFEEFAKELKGEGFPAELESINELAKATSQRRNEILADLKIVFKRDLSDNGLWQFDVGEVLGDLLAESLKQATLGESDPNFYRVNLLKLKEVMKSSPKTFPAGLREKINEIVEFGNDTSLEDPEVLGRLVEKIDIIGDLILG